MAKIKKIRAEKKAQSRARAWESRRAALGGAFFFFFFLRPPNPPAVIFLFAPSRSFSPVSPFGRSNPPASAMFGGCTIFSASLFARHHAPTSQGSGWPPSLPLSFGWGRETLPRSLFFFFDIGRRWRLPLRCRAVQFSGRFSSAVRSDAFFFHRIRAHS